MIRIKQKKFLYLSIFAFSIFALFTSCAPPREKVPVPVEEKPEPAVTGAEEATAEETVQPTLLAEEGKDPFITINSPSNRSYYRSTVIVEGRVSDSEDKPGGASEVNSLIWEIPGTSLGSDIHFSEEGSFLFSFSTVGFRGDCIIALRAESVQGRIFEKSVKLLDDGKGPALIFLTPVDMSYYASTVIVAGRVSDFEDTPGSTEEVKSLSWAVEGSPLGGNLYFKENGFFSFVFSTVGLHGMLTLSLRAEDRNGHLSERSFRLLDDRKGPILTIHSPTENSYYISYVTVEGRVSDSEDRHGSTAKVRSLSWEMIGTSSLAGDVPFDRDGSFKFDFSTEGLSGAQTLEIRAEDLRGNASVYTLTLLDGKKAASQNGALPASKLDGAELPFLTVISPENKTFYRSEVRVEGLVANSEKDPSTDQVKSMSWELPGTSLGAKVDFESNGGFHFDFSTIGLHGTQVVRLKAENQHGLFTERVLVLLDDERGPALSLISPSKRGYYKKSVTVQGRVSDSEDEPDSRLEIKSLFYEVEGVPSLTGEISYYFDGAFQFTLPTEGLSGRQTLKITAEDLNENLTQRSITLLDGNLEPSIIIITPADGSAYGSKVLVSGKVTDPYAETDDMGGIESLSYEIASSELFYVSSSALRGDIDIDRDGSFEFIFSTGELSGPQELTVAALARSGNQAKASVSLTEGDSDIPSFSVTPGGRQVTLRWEPLPSVRNYSLSYKSDNPQQIRGREKWIEGIEPPYVLRGLDNGSLYVFRLKASLPREEDSWSGEKKAIPLSSETLMPTVTGEYGQIRVAWKEIPGAEKYEVCRSSEIDGAYTNLSGEVSETVFVDNSAKYGKTYFYKVKPSTYGAIESEAIPGQTLAFPVKKLEVADVHELQDVQNIFVRGGYAYVADGGDGIKIIDISDPANLVQVSAFQTSNARDITVRGDYAYVADGSKGLKILDIYDPWKPIQIGSCKTSDAQSIVLKGDYAFVADGRKGLKVIDISRSKHPARVGYYDTFDAQAIALKGNYIFIADADEGLKIIDISRPQHPSQVGIFDTFNARDLALYEDYILIADGDKGLKVIDVADPERPILVASYYTYHAEGVDVSGNFAYVADGEEGVKVIDISDPAHPSQFDALETGKAVGISVRGHYAYVADSTGFKVIHILIQGRSFQVASSDTGGKAYGISVSKDYAYVSAHLEGLKVIDISTPAAVDDQSQTGFHVTDYAEGVAVRDNYAYVADGREGLKILDVSPAWDDNPDTQLVEVGSYYTGGTAYQVALNGAYAYIADGEEGLKVIDITVPENPVELGSLDSSDARDVAVEGDYVFLADSEGGLILIDVSDPSSPVKISSIETFNARRVVVSANYAFVVGTQGLRIVNISDPHNPAQIYSYDTSHAEDVAVSGTYAYIAEGYKGLNVLDISTPEKPVVVSSCDEVYAVAVAVKGDYAFVVDSSRLKVIHILIPAWLVPLK